MAKRGKDGLGERRNDGGAPGRRRGVAVDVVNINDIGSTAFVVAHFRSLERGLDRPLFDDPFAGLFVPEEMRERGEALRRMMPEGLEMVRYRTCLFNEMVERAVRDGVRQVVSVGAGFDMRGAMFRADGVAFYDVDQPALLDYKRGVLDRHGIAPWTSVACDYLDVNLPDTLGKAGFDTGAPALFVWEGNTMYLPLERIHGFLDQLCAGVASFSIVFDHLSEQVIARTSGFDNLTRFADFFEQTIKAPWVTGFSHPAPLLARHRQLTLVSCDSMVSVGRRHAATLSSEISAMAGLYFYSVLTKDAAGGVP